MARIFAPVVPPADPHKCAPWLNRELRRIGVAVQQLGHGQSAIARGELPDGSGTPIVDLTNFWYKPGIPNEFTAYMRTGAGASGIISSTRSPVKGYIYLGSSSGVSFNEATTLVGINTPIPAARLHISESATGGTQSKTPATGIFVGGWGLLGGGDFCDSMSASDGDSHAIQGPDLTTSVATIFGFVPPTDPGIYTGWTLTFTMRKTMTGSGLGATMDFRSNMNWTGSTWTGTGAQILGRNINCNGGIGNDIDLSDSLTYSDYTISLTPSEAAQMLSTPSNRYVTVGLSSFGAGRTDQVIRITKVVISGPGVGDSLPLQRWVSSGSISTDDLSFDSDGGSGEDLTLSGSTAFRVGSGGGSSGLRLLTDGTDGRLEVGTAARANMDLVLSGTRAVQGTQLTSDFATTYLTGVIRIAGGDPDDLKILSATDTDGNAVWRTAGELGLMLQRTPVFDYEEATGIVTTIETTVLTYVAVADMVVQGMIVTGSTNMRFKLKVNGVAKATARISVAKRTEPISFADGGISVTAGQTITITAYHEESGNQIAEAYLMGYTEA